MGRAELSELLGGDLPVVAASFTDVDADRVAAEAKAAGLDVAELRIDRFSSYDIQHVVSQVEKFTDTATIATIRSSREGGDWAGSETNRLALFEAVLPAVDGVDIELSSEQILYKVVAVTKSSGKTLIVSYHNFDRTPPAEELEGIARSAKRRGADYVKISTMANSQDDLRTLAKFTIENSELGLIVIAMGAQGAASRIFFPALGSRLTYSFMVDSSAPGQLHYTDTRDLLRKLYPQLNDDRSR